MQHYFENILGLLETVFLKKIKRLFYFKSGIPSQLSLGNPFKKKFGITSKYSY